MKIVLDPNATLPRRATPGSFGYDLALLSDTVVKSHETVLAPCGLQLGEDLPYSRRRGLAMMILPRSSLWKAGLIVVNAPGLIDADYAESILVLLHSVAPPAAELHAFRRNHTDRRIPELIKKFVRLILHHNCFPRGSKDIS